MSRPPSRTRPPPRMAGSRPRRAPPPGSPKDWCALQSASRPSPPCRPTWRAGSPRADHNHVDKSLALLPRWWVTVAQGALLAAIYFWAARFALLRAIPPGYALALSPPTGIALAALLVLGPRLWPGVWIGSLLANLSIDASIPAASIIATGSTLQALFVSA